MPRKKKIKDEPREKLTTRLFGEGSTHIVIACTLLALSLFITLSLTNTAGVLGRFVATYFERYLGLSIYIFLFSLLSVALGLARDARPTKALAGALFAYLGGTLFLESSTASILTGSIGNRLYEQSVFFIGPILTICIAGLFLLAGFLLMLNVQMSVLGDILTRLRTQKEEEAESDEDEDEDDSKEEHEDEPTYDDEIDEDDLPEDDDDAEVVRTEPHTQLPYTPPTSALLDKGTGKPRPGDIKANSNLIKRTLQNFGINVEMDEVSVGPSITRYAMKPAEGVKLSKIVGLQDNLAMALAAHPLRIEAPIPGKSLVGIEIPNTTRTLVALGPLLSGKEFQQSTKQLPFILGHNVSGQAVQADLAKAPHLLVAGATGSGKSATIHCMIQCFLFRHGPGTLRMLMIDPKRVELTLYNNIPHLLTPVITDAKKAILALKWAAKEMERRYDILERCAVRDVQSYHENILVKTDSDDKSDEIDPLPYIVIIIDELADIMSTYPRELEAAIVRLAQKSRAVGIHLIISTQRPSTDVITGLIKANIPARIALQVPSQIDSRTIIDMPGAEKLLGAGDMLYLGGDMSKPIRIQSGFVSEKEVKRIVSDITKNNPALPDDISFSEASATDNIFASNALTQDAGDDDDLYEEAREIVVDAGKASTSYLQRRLKIGYSRAARLLDMLEERNVVGPGEGSKPREVYIQKGDRQLDEDE
ncbi:MAG: DNA translocase FtsK [bacterium]|nr:DNA translocase FtsK [bacterium]